MKKFSVLLIFLALAGGWNFAKASHIAGADITYQCLGNNQFLVTLNLYRDCTGIDAPTAPTLDISSPCGSGSVTLDFDYSEEISQLCNSELQNSTCNGGNLPGMEIYVYSEIVSLNPQCNFWTLSWDLCCRNPLITNLVNPDDQDMYIQVTVNTEDYPCDNSPIFNNLHIPYVCLNGPVAYSYGVTEPDGDSLSYAFIPALEPGPNPLGYVFPYTATEPIPGITLDTQTGLIQFTPTMIGAFVVSVEISQWDMWGNLIGTIMRDVEFIVVPCAGNQPPDPTTGTISNLTGTAGQVGDYNIEMCESDNFCFDFSILDPDLLDTLTLTSTVLQTLPGATFTWSGVNPVSGQICWTSPAQSADFYTFIITADDNGCPVFATQNYVYSVEILNRTTTGPDQTICGAQGAQLSANGGTVFTWTALPGGDSIDIGVNFSCNPCADPVAQPGVNTTYVVTSDLSATCIITDTVTVYVVPDFSYNVSQSSSSICLGESIQFDITVNPNDSGYVYEWTPSTFLSATDIPDPTGTFEQPGTYQYLVEITSPDNCAKLDTTITVVVSPSPFPDISAFQLDTIICVGESTQFFVSIDNVNPSQCGPNPSSCSGIFADVEFADGTQANNSASYPAIYGNIWDGTKTQMLFRADELYGLGFTGGTFVSIGFEIIEPIAGLSNYLDWEIQMGCTTEEEMTTWISGLTSVYQVASTQPQQGMNVYNFTTNFDWDGISNIVVQTCFYNGQFVQNEIQEHTATPFNSTLSLYLDGNPNICNDQSVSQIDMLRPNTFFTMCSGIDTTNITYTWNPSDDFNDPNSPNPVVTPSGSPVTYTLIVEDTISGCSTDTTLSVSWYPSVDISFIPSPFEGLAPLDVNFNNTSGTGTGNYFWDFGDSTNTSTDVSPSFTYTEPGSYWVTLYGEDQRGCGAIWQELIVVHDEPIIEIPNVFSPNGDGMNDEFALIEFDGFSTFNFLIFNRWGMKIHSTSAIDGDKVVWRPSTDTPEGTYFYVFEGKGENGDQVQREGHITLLR